MEIEIYIGLGQGSGTWAIYDVDVPESLLETKLLDKFISEWMEKQQFEETVAFWGIYHIPPLEDE